MVKVNFEIDDEVKEFSVPESWSEVTVSQFMEIVKIQESMEELNILQKTIRMVVILTGIPEEYVEMIPIEQFYKIRDILEYTNEEVDTKACESITLDGETYFIKNEFNQLTMGETITIETLMDGSKNVIEVFDKLLCVFLRKKKENGKLEAFKSTFIEERAEIFGKAPISDMYSVLVFFSGGGSSLEASTPSSSESL
jgi:hypothetical protein